MSNLKDLRARINSIKSTQKITSAMKLVAGVKFRKSEEATRNGRPFTYAVRDSLGYVCASRHCLEKKYKALSVGKTKPSGAMIVVFSSDKGLCGNFNSSIIKEASTRIERLIHQGLYVKVVCVGSKSYEILKKNFPEIEIEMFPSSFFNNDLNLVSLSNNLLSEFFGSNEVKHIYLIYSHYFSAISNEVRFSRVLPFLDDFNENELINHIPRGQIPSFDPCEEKMVEELVKNYILTQLKQAWKESCASENGTRMTAMDNATRNAQDMLDKLVLTYNRTRQAVITAELIEVISGAEAL